MLIKVSHGFDSKEEILTLAFRLNKQSECFAHASIRDDSKGLRKNFNVFEHNINIEDEEDTQKAIKEATQLTDLFFKIMPFRKSVSLAFLDCCIEHDNDWMSAPLVLNVLENQIPEEF